MPCSVCFAHGHNIRTCQFKNGFVDGVNPTNIKEKKENKEKKQTPVFKDQNQMSLAIRDHQELYSDRTKLLENKHRQEIVIQKHMHRFPQDKQLLERVKDNTITNYNGIPGFKTIYNISSTDDNLFISNPDPIEMWHIKMFLNDYVLINRKPKPLLPIRPSDININKNNREIYNSSIRHYNREINKYKRIVVPNFFKDPMMTNKELRINHLLSMITQLTRIERTIEMTDVINHNRQSIIQPFQKKVEGIYTNTKHNRIVRLTKHYSDSIEHNTNLPDDMVRNVLSFLI